MERQAPPMFTLVAPPHWPNIALKCNVQGMSTENVHDIVFSVLKSAEQHTIVERIDECVQDGVLYVIMSLDESTYVDENKRMIALGVVQHIVAKTRKYMKKRQEAMAVHPSGSTRK